MMTVNYYWLPFPGTWQAEIVNPEGTVVSTGMGPSKDAARTAAYANVAPELKKEAAR